MYKFTLILERIKQVFSDGKLVDHKQDRFMTHSVTASFQEKTKIYEECKNTEPLWVHSQTIVPVNTPNDEHLICEEFPVENDSYEDVGVEAIASITRNNQKKFDNVLPVRLVPITFI